jgi:hypothetical protein
MNTVDGAPARTQVSRCELVLTCKCAYECQRVTVMVLKSNSNGVKQ